MIKKYQTLQIIINYLVSNKKIYNTGWKPKFSIDDGIDELVKYYSFNKKNYHKNI